MNDRFPLAVRRRFARRLRELREGLTQKEIAQRAGISRVYLNRLERAKDDPRLSIVAKLARALDVTVGDLVD